ncbi:MAG: hypothetical protein L6R39_001815 [Caloplaca ligustica]|nr:MAG: hypothetical protein L6R39_001815 [Caloplaca ligustica]
MFSKTTHFARRAVNPRKRDVTPMVLNEHQTKNNGMGITVDDLLEQCKQPWRDMRNGTSRAYRRVQEEWKDFKEWWQDPISRSNELVPLESSDMHLLPHSATTLLSQSSFTTTQSPMPYTPMAYQLPVTPLLPQEPLDSWLGSPPPAASIHCDNLAAVQDTTQRHTFERRNSGLSSGDHET